VKRTKWTLGIATCGVQAGRLTAVGLPGRELVQVRARKRYYGP
jgi:hypothetical protein